MFSKYLNNASYSWKHPKMFLNKLSVKLNAAVYVVSDQAMWCSLCIIIITTIILLLKPGFEVFNLL